MLIEFNHAVNGQKIYVVKSLIWYYYYAPSHNAVLIVSQAGAFFPVKESLDEVRSKMSAS
jgi:hypothetical protein